MTLPPVALPAAPAAADVEGRSAVDPYQLRPADITEAPRSIAAVFRRVGPGLVLAASIVGSGELIATTTLGAQVGYAALWVILVSCIVKPVIQAEMGRYTIATGETALEAMNHVPGPRFGVGWVVWAWAIIAPSLDGAPALTIDVTPSTSALPVLDFSWDVTRPTAVAARQASLTDADEDGVSADTSDSGLPPLARHRSRGSQARTAPSFSRPLRTPPSWPPGRQACCARQPGSPAVRAPRTGPRSDGAAVGIIAVPVVGCGALLSGSLPGVERAAHDHQAEPRGDVRAGPQRRGAGGMSRDDQLFDLADRGPRPLLRQVPRHGHRGRRDDAADQGHGSGRARRPARRAGACRACRTPARRSASFPARGRTPACGSSSRAATSPTRSGWAAYWRAGELPARRRRRPCKGSSPKGEHKLLFDDDADAITLDRLRTANSVTLDRTGVTRPRRQQGTIGSATPGHDQRRRARGDVMARLPDGASVADVPARRHRHVVDPATPREGGRQPVVRLDRHLHDRRLRVHDPAGARTPRARAVGRRTRAAPVARRPSLTEDSVGLCMAADGACRAPC